MSIKSNDYLLSWASFFVAHGLAIKQIEERLSGQAPLSLYEYDVLLTISKSPEQKIRYSDLASATIFTRSGITRLIKRMETSGYIRRTKCHEDQRGAFANLTESGKEALKSTWKLYSIAVLEIFENSLSPTDAKNLKNISDKIISQIKPDPLFKIGNKTISKKA